MDRPYEEQLEEKVRSVEELLGVKVERVHPSPKPHYYRNRMDYVVAPGPVIGLNVRGRWWETVDLSECLLLSPESDAIRRLFKEFMKMKGLEGWDRRRRQGTVRFLSIIEGKFTDERMVFVVSYRYVEGLGEYLEMLGREGVRVSSLVLGVNDGVRDDARADELHVVAGGETIRERIDSFTYHLHPNTFFQPNPYTLASLIGEVVRLTEPEGREILELYSGIGTFTIPLSRKASKITAVENDSYAVKIAELNLRENHVENVEIKHEKAEKVSHKYGTIVLDPPRPGLSFKLVRRLRKAKPKRIVYVSCNPRALERDVRQLGYKIEEVVVVDQFPQTPLVEAVALLRR